MLKTYYLGVAIFAAACTYLWAFRDDRITLTGTLAATAWALLALTGSEVVTQTSCCQVTTPVPAAIRYMLAALAILSLLAVILHHLGVYPPEDERDAIPDQEAGQSKPNV
jgi:hypothetical protein